MTNECSNFDIQERNNLFHSDKSLNAEPEFVACCVEEDTQRSDEVSNNIKQERCGDNDNEDCNITIINNDVDVNLDDFVDVKPNAEDSVAEKLVFIDELKEEVNILRCEACGDDYDAYCPKCPMLVRILDADIPNKIENRIKQTLPKDFFDIREISPGGVGVIVLRAIPKGITFGPFEGLIPVIGENTTKWKISDGKLDYLRDPKRLNWMQYIRYSDVSLYRNLMPFQCENQLFYQSTRTIEEGEELLVYFDECGGEVNSDANNAYIQLLIIKEKLEDVYACTFCCLGFSSATYLSKHNSVCPGKKDKDISFRESAMIVQCTFCKIYLPENEYSEYHLSRCCTRNTKLLTVHFRTKNGGTSRRKAAWKERSNNGDGLTNGAETYKCSLCEYETTNKHRFRRHQYTHSEMKRYRCPQCPYRSKTKYYIGDHLRRRHGGGANGTETRYPCPLCNESFERVSLLHVHVNMAHSGNRSHKCPRCPFRTANKKLFVRHHRTAHVVAAAAAHTRPFRCRSCPKRFACEKSLRSHIDNLHVDANRTKRFKCPKCERFETKYEASLRKHLLNVHGGVKRFRCAECPYRTTYKLSLERHLCLHENGLSVGCECEECGERFVTRTDLAAHTRQNHTPADNMYRCKKCEYRTSRRGDLKKHSVVHEHVKPHRCPECGYRSKLKGNLKRHLATHKQTRPFQCDVCRRSFTEKVSLTRHVQALHPPADAAPSKPFKCERCDFQSRHRSSLYKHLTIVHSDTKRHECIECPFKTNYKYLLTRHMYKHNVRSGRL